MFDQPREYEPDGPDLGEVQKRFSAKLRDQRKHRLEESVLKRIFKHLGLEGMVTDVRRRASVLDGVPRLGFAAFMDLCPRFPFRLVARPTGWLHKLELPALLAPGLLRSRGRFDWGDILEENVLPGGIPPALVLGPCTKSPGRALVFTVASGLERGPCFLLGGEKEKRFVLRSLIAFLDEIGSSW